MLQIEEWFRRPQRKADRREKPERPMPTAMPEAGEKRVAAVTVKPVDTYAAEKSESATAQGGSTEEASTVVQDTKTPEPSAAVLKIKTPEPSTAVQEINTPEPPVAMQAVEMPEERQRLEPNAPQEAVSLPDSVIEADEMEHISEKIGMDVADMIDLEKEDFLLRQIDEFREKARQLQQLMAARKNEAEQMQSALSEKEAKASELDELITVRQGEADKIMGNVSEKIDAMSMNVRQEMSGLSNVVSKEVSGLTQNLTHEINQSAESTRKAFETAAKQMIDQNTRSLEGLKEQLEQLGQLDQINELSTEMNSRITTLKTDIADKIHAEDVKCYRNIQASMNEQNKLISDADEKTRQHVQEQMDGMQERISAQAKLLKVTLAFTILNFLGIVGILAFLLL